VSFESHVRLVGKRIRDSSACSFQFSLVLTAHERYFAAFYRDVHYPFLVFRY